MQRKIQLLPDRLFLQSNLGFSSAVPAPDPIHDAVTQGQGFTYLTYALNRGYQAQPDLGHDVGVQPVPQSFRTSRRSSSSTTSIRRLHPSSAIDSGLDQQDYYGVLALNGVIGSNADYQLAYSDALQHANILSRRDRRSHLPGHRVERLQQRSLQSTAGRCDLSLGTAHTLRGGFYFGEYGVESDQHLAGFSDR